MIKLTLQALTQFAWRNRLDPKVHMLARKLTDPEASRQKKMEAIVAELHRRSVHIPSPADVETLAVIPFDAAAGWQKPIEMVPLDADDACAFVAAAAMSVGIRCRLVAVRYGQSWTCWVAYEVGDHWETVDPLRARPAREPGEIVMGPMPEEGDER